MMDDRASVPPGQFYEAVGRATSAWQNIEDRLRRVLTTALDHSFGAPSKSPWWRSPNYQVAAEIFFATTNFRTTLNMLSGVLGHLDLQDAHLSEWKAIQNKANALYKKRNIIVHGHVWGNDGLLSAVGYSLLKPVPKRDLLSYAQICACEGSFLAQAERIENFDKSIREHLSRPS